MKRFSRLLICLTLLFALGLSGCGQPVTDTSLGAESSALTSDEVSFGEVVSEQDSSKETSSKESEAQVMRLQNAYKLLTEEKKLTIGYIGGSITHGYSAATVIENGKVVSTDGSIRDNYVHRVSAWFKSVFPDAEIETINAGIGDTTTNFALYRLESHLMNNNGHDIPDIVFIEFTTNDAGSYETTVTQLESLINNILEINPYCEIVIISTNVYGGDAKAAHKDVALNYKFLFADVGQALQDAKIERGAASESDGTYYYTVDNLHPSSAGYALYTEKIVYLLEYHLSKGTGEMINRKETLPASLSKHPLVTNPVMITGHDMLLTGDAEVVETALTAGMYGMAEKGSQVPVCDSFVKANNGSTATIKFSGSYLGVLFGLTKDGVNIRYCIDGGEWKEFLIDSQNRSGQRYDHSKTFAFASDLSQGDHTLVIEFNSDTPIRLGAVLVNGR